MDVGHGKKEEEEPPAEEKAEDKAEEKAEDAGEKAEEKAENTEPKPEESILVPEIIDPYYEYYIYC